MRSVPMIAVRSMNYLSRELEPGEAFDCSPAYARIAERKGRALPKSKAEAIAVAAPVRRRAYRRRELTVEP